MAEAIEESDVWLLCELYSVLGSFAGDPQHTINRISGGRNIMTTDDLANHLSNVRETVLQRYPGCAELGVIRVATEIDAILSRRSLGGEEFDEFFWTDKGFQEHEDWRRIRELSRAFLIR